MMDEQAKQRRRANMQRGQQWRREREYLTGYHERKWDEQIEREDAERQAAFEATVNAPLPAELEQQLAMWRGQRNGNTETVQR